MVRGVPGGLFSLSNEAIALCLLRRGETDVRVRGLHR